MAKHRYKLIGVEPTRQRTLMFECRDCGGVIYMWRYPLYHMLTRGIEFHWMYLSTKTTGLPALRDRRARPRGYVKGYAQW